MLNKLTKLREERAEGEKGFTLIELLVVVVIIGVLVAIAIPLYLNYRKGAQNRAAQSDVRNAVSAVEQCIGDNAGKVPAVGTSATADTTAATPTKVLNLTCKSDGTGTVTAAAAADPTAQQTINVSDGNKLQYKVVTGGYQLVGTSAASATYTYDSTTGKTT